MAFSNGHIHITHVALQVAFLPLLSTLEDHNSAWEHELEIPFLSAEERKKQKTKTANGIWKRYFYLYKLNWINHNNMEDLHEGSNLK